MMQKHFEYLKITRENFLSILDSLTLEEINRAPKGYGNHIGWNFGHSLVTQQLLTYKLSGVPCLIPDDVIDRYRKGSLGNPLMSLEELNKLKELAIDLVAQTQKDYELQLFTSYQEYTTSYHATLSNVEDAIIFNNIHEGLHLGYAMAMKRSL